jgi:arsenite-transporting ATPase
VQLLEFDVTVFDTAPTGHTLRLLALPGMLDKALSKILTLRGKFGGMFGAIQGLMGGGGAGGLPSEDQLLGKLDEIKAVVDAVQARIHNADETTFVCVCIPEFLSLYETERLVQELAKFEIDTHNIVVNQVLFVATGSACSRCLARRNMQGKYLDQIADLYGEDFHVVTTPLLNEEVRGAPRLRAFSEFLTQPYDPAVPLPQVLGGVAE